MMLIKNINIYNDEGQFHIGNILIDKERIQQVRDITILELDKGNTPMEDPLNIVVDGTGLYAIPGLTDLHFHGCAGYDFCDGTKVALEAIASYEAIHGITTICPATMTLPEENLSEICRNAADFDLQGGSILCGIHMEGPFLSVKKKGAQNAAFLHKPDISMYHRLNQLCKNKVKIVSIAPEEEGSMEFIAALKEEVILSLAHSTAGYDTALEAFHQGASHVTHLYNAMPPFHHRDPGVIGAAFDSPNSTVELICDGIHIHPSVVRATLAMFGEDRVIFISDSMRATGLPDGTYSLGGQSVEVKGKTAALADGTIAGSVTNLMDCLKNAVKNFGIPFEVAIKAAVVNPAKKIGIYNEYGSITPGKFANIVLLDQELNVNQVILKGSIIKSK